MKRRRLHAVSDDEAATAHAVVICTDLEALAVTAELLAGEGYVIMNLAQDGTSDEMGLAYYLPMLAQADAIALPADWWASVVGHQLMQIASWLRMVFIDEAGCELETVKSSAAAR